MWKAKAKQVLKLRMTMQDHQALGHKLVAHWGQEDKDYSFDFMKYKIVEVCKGDLKGHCWIKKC